MTPHPEIWPLFIATWVVLGTAGSWLTFIDKNAPRKKRLLPVFIIGTGATFVVFVFLITRDLRVLAFVLPAAVLISLLNLRMTKVCSSCERFRVECGSLRPNTVQNAVQSWNRSAAGF
jgi:hypothetical protein